MHIDSQFGLQRSNHQLASPHPSQTETFKTKTKTNLLQMPRFLPLRRSSRRRQLDPGKGGSSNSGTRPCREQMQQSPRNDSIRKLRYLVLGEIRFPYVYFFLLFFVALFVFFFLMHRFTCTSPSFLTISSSLQPDQWYPAPLSLSHRGHRIYYPRTRRRKCIERAPIG